MAQFRTAIDDQISAAQETTTRQFVDNEGLFANELSEKELENITAVVPDSSIDDAAFAAGPGDASVAGFDYVADDVSADPGQRENESGSAPIETRENPLDVYPNYTYGISLHYLDLTNYNSIATGNGDSYNSTNGEVLVASGGRRGDTMSRNQYFEGDMYFENLKLNTIIGYNSRTRASNVIDVNFTIIEPYSMTFLNKIIKIAKDNGIKAWDQMPFLLQIDFFANDETGPLANPVEGQSKRIVIRIIDIKVKLTSKGSEYAISAIPASHIALTQSVATIPINIEVVCKKVKDFFDSSAGMAPGGEPERVQEDIEGIGVSQEVEKEPTVSKAYSLPAALKSYQKKLVEKKHQEQEDEYVFVIDDIFADADIITKKQNQPFSNLPPTNDDNPNTNIDFNKTITRINAGTSITEVINQTLFASSYYSEIIKKKGSGPMLTHRIRTTVTYDPGAWDNIRKEYKKTITFYIEKYEYYNQKFPQAPKSVPSKAHKQYYYMYTGKNQQILDLNIDFNAMFYVAITSFESKAERRMSHRSSDPKEANKKDDIDPGNDNSATPLRIKPIIGHSDAQSSKNNSKESVEAIDFQKTLMGSSRGDMLNVKMKIAGDPELIKQDDTYYSPGSGSGNSIPMDIGELFVGLFFRTPDDLNLETGLYDFDTDGENVFNGSYRVIAVENQFERGQFTQTLDMIRLFDQDGQRPRSAAANDPDQEREAVEQQPTNDANVGSGDVDLGSFNQYIDEGPIEENIGEAFSGDGDNNDGFGSDGEQEDLKEVDETADENFDPYAYFGTNYGRLDNEGNN